MAATQQVFEIAQLFEVSDPNTIESHSVESKRVSTLTGSYKETEFTAPLPESSGPRIEHCCFQESPYYNVLALYMSNNYFVIRLDRKERLHSNDHQLSPVVKQVQWFEDRLSTVMDMTFDPRGEWLACVSLSGAVHLIPVAPTMIGESPKLQFGPLDDVETIKPGRKIAPPTSVVWWESIEGRNYIITGSEKGEITLFDLQSKRARDLACFTGCVNSLQILSQPKRFSHLLVCLRGLQWWALPLEEAIGCGLGSTSAASTSILDTSPNFELLSGVITILTGPEVASQFEPFKLKFIEYRLQPLKWNPDRHYLGAHNLRTHMLEIYSTDLHVENVLYAFHLPLNATHTLVSERLLFSVYHNDEAETMSLSVLSVQKAKTGSATRTLTEPRSLQTVILMGHSFPPGSIIKGLYPISWQWNGVLAHQADCPVQTTNLEGCIVIVDNGVYHLRQRSTLEHLFLELALTQPSLNEAEELAISFDLNIHELCRVVAQTKLERGDGEGALNIYLHSTCAVEEAVKNLVQRQYFEELLTYIDHVLDDYSKKARCDERWLMSVVLHCYIHQVLLHKDNPHQLSKMDKIRQRLVDDFLLNPEMVLESFFSYGLVEEAVEYAKAKGVVADALLLMMKSGCLAADNQNVNSLATSRYLNTVSTVGNGLFLQMMPPQQFVQALCAKPTILPTHIHHVREIIPQCDASLLVQLAKVLDPSQSTIKPLLLKAMAHPRPRRGSTGSIVSTVSDSSIPPVAACDEHSLSVEEVLELFLIVLIHLDHRRGQEPLPDPDASHSRVLGSGAVPVECVLSCGWEHSAVVQREGGGTLLTWGTHKDGKLGHSDLVQEGVQSQPQKVDILVQLGVQVKSVSCGQQHTLVLSQQGVYSWGANSYGQLGHGDFISRSQPVPIAKLVDRHIVQIASGQNHCLAISDNHRVWTWGCNSHSQLGLKDTTADLDTPTHVTSLDQHIVVMVSGGNRHSIAVASDGQLLTFGSGSHGQLGHGNRVKQAEPKVVQTLTEHRVVMAACGAYHTMVADDRGRLFVFGKNFFGEDHLSKAVPIHHGSPSTSSGLQDFLLPTLLPDGNFPSDIVQISCGSTHSLLLTRSGGVYSWGTNAHGQLGHRGIIEVSCFQLIPALSRKRAIAVACGNEYSAALDDSGHLWAWGRADGGQLGLPTAKSKSPAHLKGSGDFRGDQLVRVLSPLISRRLGVTRQQRESRSRSTGSEDSREAEAILSTDLEWELPNLRTVGPPTVPYNIEALHKALWGLHGHYRLSPLVNACQDCQDWSTLSVLYGLEGQWPQALDFSLRFRLQSGSSLPGHTQEKVDQYSTVLIQVLSEVFSEKKNIPAEEYLHSATETVRIAVVHWDAAGLPMSSLEDILTPHLPELAQAVYHALPSCPKGQLFSLKFQMAVAEHVMREGTTGLATAQSHSHSEHEEVDVKPANNRGPPLTSAGGTTSTLRKGVDVGRMWETVRRNLAKDMGKSSGAVTVTDQSLLNSAASKGCGFVAFTCGHAFTETQMSSKLLEFDTRMRDLPGPHPPLLAALLGMYRTSPTSYTSPCPVCVFQCIRKLQLAEYSTVPIKPWTVQQ